MRYTRNHVLLALSPTCTFTRFFIVLLRLAMSKVFAIAKDMKNAGYESHVCTMLIIVTYNMLIGLHNKSFMTQKTLVIFKKCMMLGACCIPSMISSFRQLTLTYVGGCSGNFVGYGSGCMQIHKWHHCSLVPYWKKKNHSLILRLHTNNCNYISTLQHFYNFNFQQEYIQILKKKKIYTPINISSWNCTNLETNKNDLKYSTFSQHFCSMSTFNHLHLLIYKS